MASQAMITVLELHEQMKMFAGSDLYRKGKSEGAAAFLFDTIAHYELAQICRLWDKCDADGFSFLAIAWLLNNPDVKISYALQIEQTRLRSRICQGRQSKGRKKRIDDLRPDDVEFAVIRAARIMQMLATTLSQRASRLYGLADRD
jgi:hypothetical protein